MTARLVDVQRHLPAAFAGRVELLTLESELLRGNPLGDPHVRELVLYTPPLPAGDDGSDLPLLLLLPAFTSRPHALYETHPWRRGVLARYDAEVARGAAAPARVAAPDAFTALGGSQYVDSSATGPYERHVLDEVLPLAAEHAGSPPATGVLGKSSGGFGALHLALRHPGRFAACASISGDCGFDMLFPGELLACLRGLQAHEGDPARFLAAFHADPDLSGDGHAVINVLAMAACYSPNPESALGFDLPLDLATGELVDDVWRRWLAFDPLVAVEAGADALRELTWLHLECGLADEFHLQWGARRLSRRLRALGVPHTHEEHPGGHRGLDGRVVEILGRMAAPLRTYGV